jgi:hypothetical protein
MFVEHELVRLRTDRPSDGLTTRHIGTIVHVYESYPPAYEVEFNSDDGLSLLALLTVTEDELQRVVGWSRET